MPLELGPNTRLVAAFLRRVVLLDLARWTMVVRTWRDDLRLGREWHEAEDAVGDALARTERHEEQWRLQDRLFALFHETPWYTDPRACAQAAGTEAAAQYLASTAAFALLVADAIDVRELGVLYAPFAVVLPMAELLTRGADVA